ncbi:hypothetical protein ACIQ57_07110 [Lysinibacillus xylanilyticus]|uniref:hypothetical protein n=1 Tax=Lysinibacillus xylanilyticus TaxID=582475 RepID=UPI003822E808
MDNFYAIHGGASIYSVVKANSEEEAFNVFARNQINDKHLREEIGSFTVNASLLEKFYKDEDGSFFDDYTGEYPKILKNMSEEERENHVVHHIEKNINEFWKATPHFAEEYFNELQKQWGSEEIITPSFSKEFYIETIKLIIKDGNWFDNFAIVKIDLDEKDYQNIFID